MTLVLHGSIFRNTGVCPCATYDGEIGGFKFWHDWMDNGEKRPYRDNTVQIGRKLYTWFEDKVDLPAIAAQIAAGDYSVWINRPVGRLACKFNPARLP